MSNTFLLAVSLQRWEQPSACALEARDVAAALAHGTSKYLHVLSVYAYESINTYGLSHDMAAKYRDEQIQRLDACMQRKIAAYVAPLKAAGVPVSQLLRGRESARSRCTGRYRGRGRSADHWHPQQTGHMGDAAWRDSPADQEASPLPGVARVYEKWPWLRSASGGLGVLCRISHIPPDFVVDGAPQRVRAAHALISR